MIQLIEILETIYVVDTEFVVFDLLGTVEITFTSLFYFCTDAKNFVRSELQNIKHELYNDGWIDRQTARLL